jgi:dihydrofolate reductase
MRRIVMFNRVTADGYFAAPDGSLAWAVPDEELDKSAAEQTSNGRPGALLFGRRTYEMFEEFWPRAVASLSGANDPHGGGPLTPEQRAMGVWINEANKIVFSRTRKSVTWKNSKLLHELDPGRIEALKREPGHDIMIFGSGSIVSQLSDHRLIDEYQFVLNPILLGDGRSMVSGLSESVGLDLLGVKQYASGNVMLRYSPRKSG